MSLKVYATIEKFGQVLHGCQISCRCAEMRGRLRDNQSFGAENVPNLDGKLSAIRCLASQLKGHPMIQCKSVRSTHIGSENHVASLKLDNSSSHDGTIDTTYFVLRISL